MLLYITGIGGFVLSVLAIFLILIFHKKDKSKLIPLILYALGFILFMGSGFLHWKGIELKLPEKEPDDMQQADVDDTDSTPDNEEPADFISIIGDSSAQFSKEVPNDVTGRWRLFVYNSSENIVDHAVEYYNEYFESDDEVHVIVNRELQTTTVINPFSGSLSVDVHEYIEGEENDAKILGGGTLIGSYVIDISSGETADLGTSNADPINENEDQSVSLQTVENLIRIALAENFQNCTTSVDEESETVYVNVWMDGLAQEMLAASTSQENGYRESWDTAKANMVSLTNSMKDLAGTAGRPNTHILLNVLNDQNTENTLLSILDGITIYDALEE